MEEDHDSVLGTEDAMRGLPSPPLESEEAADLEDDEINEEEPEDELEEELEEAIEEDTMLQERAA